MQDVLAKYFEGTTSKEELQSIEKWIEQNPIEFSQYSKIWTTGKSYAYPKNNNSFDLIKSQITPESKKVEMSPKFSFWKIAASFLLLAAFSFLAYTYLSNDVKSDEFAVVYSSEADLKQINLEDGTKIWLKPHSKIEVSDAFNEEDRNIKLSGNAFFDVAREESKPFTIESNEITVRVLGTSFSIEEKNKDITVTVRTGKVKVSNEFRETTLLPKQAVTHKNKSDKFVFSNIKDENKWAWTDKVLTFEESNLKDVVSKIEETYGVSIEYNHSYDQVPFTGKFDNKKIAEIMNILKSSLNIDFKVSNATTPLY